jgi:hypothetical protein
LVKLFKAIVGKRMLKERAADFISLVKAAGMQDKASGKITRKEQKVENFPTLSDIFAAIPLEGITCRRLGRLGQAFQGEVE